MAQMNEQLVAEVVRQVLQALHGKAAPAPASASKGQTHRRRLSPFFQAARNPEEPQGNAFQRTYP
jgi:propanediol dehydratase small subunit